MTKLYTNVALM